MPRKSRKLKVGDRAPGFKLEDAASGRQVALEELIGEPLMIVFLRGTW
jgi:peroxiredoxin